MTACDENALAIAARKVQSSCGAARRGKELRSLNLVTSRAMHVTMQLSYHLTMHSASLC
jgi:hypothetical protein